MTAECSVVYDDGHTRTACADCFGCLLSGRELTPKEKRNSRAIPNDAACLGFDSNSDEGLSNTELDFDRDE